MDWTAIYHFWFGEPKADRYGDVWDFWFSGGPEINEEIVRRFSAAYSDAVAGKLFAWADATRSAVSRILLLDQFPRNMFPGDERSLENDHLAPLPGVTAKNDRTS